MADRTYVEALADNELVEASPGLNQELIDGTEIFGATSATLLDSGVTFATIRAYTLLDPEIMLKSEYGSPTTGIVKAAERVDDGAGSAKTAGEITGHIDNTAIHATLNDTLTTTSNVWSASKINTELGSKASATDLTNHVNDLSIHRALNDTLTTTTNLWSASKIDTDKANTADLTAHTGDASIHAELDDLQTTTSNLWSASKIDTEKADASALTSHVGDGSIHFVINDAGVSASETWSANKINTELGTKVDTTTFNSHVGDTSHLTVDERNAITNSPNAPTGVNPFATQADITGGSKHVIQDEGVNLTARTNLNFTGPGVTATDNAANDATDVTITSGGSKHIIQEEGIGLPSRTNLNFIGPTITAADDSGNDATTITSDAMAGPGSSVDNRLMLFDGATGKLAKQAGIVENDVLALPVANQLIGVTEKATPVSGDRLLLEDSEAAGAKKWVDWASLPSGGGGDLTDAVFPTYAVFDAIVPAPSGAVDFATGNVQEINAGVFPAITLTSPTGRPAKFTLKILNSASLISIAPAAGGTIEWAGGTPPSWAGKSSLYLAFDGTTWEGSANVNVS